MGVNSPVSRLQVQIVKIFILVHILHLQNLTHINFIVFTRILRYYVMLFLINRPRGKYNIIFRNDPSEISEINFKSALCNW